MKRPNKPTDFVFQVSWEVCNKVGGIYTVLSTQARVLENIYGDDLIFIGPDLHGKEENPLFLADETILSPIKKLADKEGIPVRFGHWNVPGNPIVALVEYDNLRPQRDEIYKEMWESFGVDSLHGYGDYDDSCLFGWQAGRLAALAYGYYAGKNNQPTAVLQAHEWMSAFALLHVKKHEPRMATVFTTHATTVGRSITTNDKPLYTYFSGYDGDQMAAELNVQSKHSAEKAAALHADCMTTVSELTDRECSQFLGRQSDILLPNGFDPSFSYKGVELQVVRRRARKRLLTICNALNGSNLTEHAMIISTSGRNDFRCKGFDLFINALKRLQDNNGLERDILAVIAVPCWVKQARPDLLERLAKRPAIKVMDATGMPVMEAPFITHELYNYHEERLVRTILDSGLRFGPDEKLHLLLIPTYLDGNDGVVNLPYYDFLTASDYCVYPSYYEPWGYTPLESIAFGIPCLTTSLSGFGQWVSTTIGHQPLISDGVAVLPRNDENYWECVEEIAASIRGMSMMSASDWRAFSDAARKLSDGAKWKDFINNYLRAYTLALKNDN
ncbi:MAG: glycogen/starch synthase [Bacteroidaceae bacterium]|nr:glycogen/starch synthase [Bacteroidaceae bacterium]